MEIFNATSGARANFGKQYWVGKSVTFTAVGRSWLYQPVFSNWGALPFIPIPLLGYDPAAYGVFLSLLSTDTAINDHGGTAEKDGAYRLWSKVEVSGCVLDGEWLHAEVSAKDKAGGSEVHGLFNGTFDFDGEIELDFAGDLARLSYKFSGRPNLALEPGFQAVRPRLSRYIWHTVRVFAKTDSLGNLTFNESVPGYGEFDGSNFPTHDFFLDGTLRASFAQGPISELWRSNPSDSSYVAPQGLK